MREVLDEIGYTGWPKTSGNRGIHIACRIEPQWEFPVVRRCALAFAREIERRAPELVTTAWWKEERGEKVFIDYNQNARDRTIASAYSVRPRPDATVSAPVTWDELPDVETEDFTLATMPARFAALGDVQAGIDDAVCDLRVLLEWVERDESDGLGEAPYPPNFPKMPGEPPRVQPSRAKKIPGFRAVELVADPVAAAKSPPRRAVLALAEETLHLGGVDLGVARRVEVFGRQVEEPDCKYGLEGGGQDGRVLRGTRVAGRLCQDGERLRRVQVRGDGLVELLEVGEGGALEAGPRPRSADGAPPAAERSAGVRKRRCADPRPSSPGQVNSVWFR